MKMRAQFDSCCVIEFQTLEDEKTEISSNLQRHLNDAAAASRDIEHLSKETNDLSEKLHTIESKMAALNHEKNLAMEKYVEWRLLARASI